MLRRTVTESGQTPPPIPIWATTSATTTRGVQPERRVVVVVRACIFGYYIMKYSAYDYLHYIAFFFEDFF